MQHMGPTAQNLRAVFGLGISNRLIDATDSDGEALAAIQGLDSVVGGLDGAVVVKALEIEVLQEDMDALKARLSDLLQR